MAQWNKVEQIWSLAYRYVIKWNLQYYPYGENVEMWKMFNFR